MKRIIISILALLAMSSVAFAQSTVTGTLSSGSSATTTGTGTVTGTVGSGTTVTGTVGSGNSLTGTVVAPPTSGGGTGGGGGGGGGGNGPPISGGGGGSGSGTIDICPNLADVQSTLPAGYVLINGNCDPAGTTSTGPGSVLGVSTDIPSLPNTGAGGTAPEMLLTLVLSALATLGGMLYFVRGKRILQE